MNKVLLSKAIKDETTFLIGNYYKTFSQPYYYSINGRIRFIKLKKAKIKDYDLKGLYPRELIDNPIVCLSLEYINLNKSENSIEIFENNCKLVDLDEYEFKVYSTNRCNFIDNEEEIYRIFGLLENTHYGENTLVPKIKHKINLFFIVPDEDSEYYFKIKNGSIEEV